jgi:hypothetical protein
MYNVALYDFGYYDLARYDSIYITEEVQFENIIQTYLIIKPLIKNGYIDIIKPKLSVDKNKINLTTFLNKPQISL